MSDSTGDIYIKVYVQANAQSSKLYGIAGPYSEDDLDQYGHPKDSKKLTDALWEAVADHVSYERVEEDDHEHPSNW